MKDFDQEFAKKVIEALNKKAPSLKCPACKKEDFGLLPGYHVHSLQKNINFSTLPPNGVTAITIGCNNCGYLLNFAPEKLGIKNNDGPKE